MKVNLINVGYGNIVAANRIISIVGAESAPIKRIIADAKEAKKLIDASFGKKTRSVIIMDSGHVILSAVQPETVAGRINVNLSKEKDYSDE
ncbi:DUF370 domain-containing protein [Megamonas hypermegale]|uniref:Putative regulatory protein K8V65_01905 n=1 Tax=Megamonas hypermegale TaxID=158847 RepID=A0A921HLT4_9FIRM|nr:DUF370 domain-containing protein [Megamonas hypermegale]MDM8143044.1 DUF370 domain-containing protein [Megamonas hypermegale]HJF84409.1 DUF370 domain-containing protein [Megamonas hypermegale]